MRPGIHFGFPKPKPKIPRLEGRVSLSIPAGPASVCAVGPEKPQREESGSCFHNSLILFVCFSSGRLVKTVDRAVVLERDRTRVIAFEVVSLSLTLFGHPEVGDRVPVDILKAALACLLLSV